MLDLIARYQELGHTLHRQMRSTQQEERWQGRALAQREYPELQRALELALEHRLSIDGIYQALSLYWGVFQQEEYGLTVKLRIQQALQQYPAAQLAGQDGALLRLVLEEIAGRYTYEGRHSLAQACHEQQLALIDRLTDYPEPQRMRWKAAASQELAMAMEYQQQLRQAEANYQRALALWAALNDKEQLCGVYELLGMLAQEQGQLAQAEEYYHQALALAAELNLQSILAGISYRLGEIAQEQGRRS